MRPTRIECFNFLRGAVAHELEPRLVQVIAQLLPLLEKLGLEIEQLVHQIDGGHGSELVRETPCRRKVSSGNQILRYMSVCKTDPLL